MNACAIEVNACEIEMNTHSVEVNTRSSKVNAYEIEVNTRAIEVNAYEIEVNTHAIEVNACSGGVNKVSWAGCSGAAGALLPGARGGLPAGSARSPFRSPTETPWLSKSVQSSDGDVLPEISGSESTEMTDVGGGNDQVGFAQSGCLSSQDHVAIDRFVSRCRLALLASPCPERCRMTQGCCREGQIFQKASQRVQPLDSLDLARSQQLPANLVVSDLGEEDPRSTAHQCL